MFFPKIAASQTLYLLQIFAQTFNFFNEFYCDQPFNTVINLLILIHTITLVRSM